MIQQSLSKTELLSIEQEIRNIFLEEYGKNFVGNLKVEDKSDGILLKLYLTQNEFNPTAMYFQCSSIEDFLEKVRHEIRVRAFDTVKYYTGFQFNINDYRQQTQGC